MSLYGSEGDLFKCLRVDLHMTCNISLVSIARTSLVPFTSQCSNYHWWPVVLKAVDSQFSWLLLSLKLLLMEAIDRGHLVEACSFQMYLFIGKKFLFQRWLRNSIRTCSILIVITINLRWIFPSWGELMGWWSFMRRFDSLFALAMHTIFFINKLNSWFR